MTPKAAMDHFNKAAEEAMRQEDRLHEEAALKLLEENGVPLSGLTALELSHGLNTFSVEEQGYYLQHLIGPPGDEEGQVHEWKLYKLVDSTKYRVQRVVLKVTE